jgi:LPS sulfotransferase NodH
MKQIDLMIIGAQKAGTTSLKNYLGEHPALSTHPQIEFSFFRDDTEYGEGYETAFKKYFPKGTDQKVVAKNAGMYYEMDSIIRLKEHNPDCKIVFLLREPVARLVSAYKMEKYNGWLKHSMSEFVNVAQADDQEHLIYRLFIRLGLYSLSMKEITEHFSIDQIRLIDYNELKQNPNGVCQDLFEWLGVDASFSPDTDKKHNESKAAKSKTYSSIIQSLRSEGNLLKKTAKKVLPQKTFAKLGNKIIESNKSDKTIDVGLSDEQKSLLSSYYQRSLNELEELYGFDTSNWKS